MTNGPLPAAALVSLPEAQAVAQPTAQQVARFEQQLQQPATASPAYYQVPLPGTVGVAGNWHVMMHDVGQMAEQYRADATALNDASAPPSAQPQDASANFLKGMAQLSHMSYTMLNISFITTTERLAGENVRSLYQLG